MLLQFQVIINWLLETDFLKAIATVLQYIKAFASVEQIFVIKSKTILPDSFVNFGSTSFACNWYYHLKNRLWLYLEHANEIYSNMERKNFFEE